MLFPTWAATGATTGSGNPLCFNRGTKILCLGRSSFEDEYVPIEELRKGDLVKSYRHGYRRIERIGHQTMINNPSTVEHCMYEMTHHDGLTEPLLLTGLHSVLVSRLSKSERIAQQKWNFMVPKRRFWKADQTFGYAFSKHFSHT